MKIKRLLLAVAALVALVLPARPADAAAWSGWEYLGGVLNDGTGVAATSWGPNRIDFFVNGTDGATWHKWWDGGAWGAWESLGGCSNATPAAVSTDPNTVEVFVVGCGASTSALWHKSWRNGAWSEWRSEGGEFIAGLAATTWGNGRWDVLAISPANRLQHVWFDGQVHMEELHRPGDSVSMVAGAAWSAGRLDVFAINNAVMQHRYFENSVGWSPPWVTVDDIANRGLGAVSWGPGRIDVFTRGNNTDIADGTVFHKWYNQGSGWSAERENQNGNATPGPIGAASWAPGRLDVFVQGTDHAVWHKYYG